MISLYLAYSNHTTPKKIKEQMQDLIKNYNYEKEPFGRIGNSSVYCNGNGNMFYNDIFYGTFKYFTNYHEDVENDPWFFTPEESLEWYKKNKLKKD